MEDIIVIKLKHFMITKVWHIHISILTQENNYELGSMNADIMCI